MPPCRLRPPLSRNRRRKLCIHDVDARDQYHPPNPPLRLPDLSTAVATHEMRLFDDNIPNSAWNRDAFEDVLFQEGANLMCLPTAQPTVRMSPNATNSLIGVEQLILAMSDPDRDGIMTLVHLLAQSKVMENQNLRQAFIRLASASQFIESLCKTFRETEVRGDVELLGALNILVRSLFRLGANNVLEVLLSEKCLTDVIGCLEYDEQNLPRFSRALNELKRKRVLREEKKCSNTVKENAENASDMAHVRSDRQHGRARNARSARNALDAKATVIECQSDSPCLKDKSQAVSPSGLVSLSDGDVTEASSEHLATRPEEHGRVGGVDETAVDGKARKDGEENIMMSSAIDEAKPVVFERLNHALDQRRKLRFGSISSNDQKQCSAQDDDCGDADAVQAHSDDAKHEVVQGAHISSSTPQATIGEEAVSDETKKGEHCSSATFSANSSRSRATEAASDTNITSSREASTTMRKSSNHNNKGGKKNVYDSGTCDVKSSERSVDTRSELMSTLGFLKELCGIVRGQQLVLKDRFYSLLLELGVLDAVLILLEEEDNGLRSLACDILSAVIIHNPSEVRNRILKNVTQQDSSGPRRQVGNDDSKLERKTTGPMMTDTQTCTASNDKRDRAGSAENMSTIEAVSRRSDGDDARKGGELRDAGGKQGMSEEKTLQVACRNGLSAAEYDDENDL
ncbi:multidrug efflux RND transporter subunit MdtA [Gracilaria domingensis]|nr:multidrug efflux RND transporter subunit MdtA [Gracilaria domingensis]